MTNDTQDNIFMTIIYIYLQPTYSAVLYFQKIRLIGQHNSICRLASMLIMHSFFPSEKNCSYRTVLAVLTKRVSPMYGPKIGNIHQFFTFDINHGKTGDCFGLFSCPTKSSPSNDQLACTLELFLGLPRVSRVQIRYQTQQMCMQYTYRRVYTVENSSRCIQQKYRCFCLSTRGYSAGHMVLLSCCFQCRSLYKNS